MSLNGLSLYALTSELSEKLISARVDKIYQENKDILMYLRSGRENLILYFCFSADNPALYLTDKKFDNPKEPPMFTMLLRKYLVNSRIKSIKQVGLDRILTIIFETSSEIYDHQEIAINFELMGKYSNLILYDNKSYNILDALIRVYPDMSSVRLVLPKENYVLPISDKKNLLLLNKDSIKTILETHKNEPLSKVLYKYLEGFSPEIAREILFQTNIDEATNFSSLEDLNKSNLVDKLLQIQNLLLNRDFKPTVIFKKGKPSKLSPFEISSEFETKSFNSMNEAVKFFYDKRALEKIQTARSSELEKKITNKMQSLKKTLAILKKDYMDSKDRDDVKKKADLLAANIYRLNKGDSEIEVQDFYSSNLETISIKVDPRLSPKKNVEKLYARYTKLKHREEFLSKRIPHVKNEIYYLESVLINLKNTRTIAELDAIKDELTRSGYLKIKSKKKIRKEKIQYIEAKTPSNLDILAGRNNLQNDELTFKIAHKQDMWFHVRNEPGTHLILRAYGSSISEEDIVYSARLAARLSGKTISTDVDYTEVKNVKKIPGAKPGLVNYFNYKTINVNPEDLPFEEQK